MTVVFDATTLLVMLSQNPGTPVDSNGNQITYPKERVDGLLSELAKSKTKIIIPTPALSEALVRAGTTAAPAYLAALQKSAQFSVESFDERAALEVAYMCKAAIDTGDKKAGSLETWVKVKFDRQIVAIAKVAGASTIYTDDKNLRYFASKHGVRTVGIGELPIPASSAQLSLPVETGANESDSEDDEKPA